MTRMLLFAFFALLMSCAPAPLTVSTSETSTLNVVPREVRIPYAVQTGRVRLQLVSFSAGASTSYLPALSQDAYRFSRTDHQVRLVVLAEFLGAEPVKSVDFGGVVLTPRGGGSVVTLTAGALHNAPQYDWGLSVAPTFLNPQRAFVLEQWANNAILDPRTAYRALLTTGFNGRDEVIDLGELALP